MSEDGWDIVPTGAKKFDLGEGSCYTKVNYQDEWVGINEWHRLPNGKWCGGWVPFAGMGWAAKFEPGAIQTWEVLSLEPLTLSPSLLCTTCQHHGFIREGRWVPA